MPLGSILNALFIIFLNNLLFLVLKSAICSFVDDNTISSGVKILGDILHHFKFNLGYILKWFKVNSLKPHPCKIRFMILETNTTIKVNLLLDGNKVEKSQKVILPGITTDDKVSFKTHIKNIC